MACPSAGSGRVSLLLSRHPFPLFRLLFQRNPQRLEEKGNCLTLRTGGGVERKYQANEAPQSSTRSFFHQLAISSCLHGTWNRGKRSHLGLLSRQECCVCVREM
ncbi:hypothetical protein TNCT_569301 [Trichonephila clavata]|uniref:Uncharacterized protein n=1 Tax=Trichonephila clavata TaxID=2740835 RepID=A0A8X6K223_TRICU|nr:hypothetical protein TNCT_569301 [Trichonephila clavata]